MAKKMEGYWQQITNNHGRFWEVPFSEHTKPRATLVVHEGKPERVFTESEVRAMVSEMVEGVTAGEELTLETIASKHGVSLDPA